MQLPILLLVTAIPICFMLIEGYRTSRKLKNEVLYRFGRPTDESSSGDLDSIRQYWNKKRYYSSKQFTIDELTWSDLDMDKVYKKINACNTSVGEEYLYAVLHEISKKEALDNRERLIDYLDKNSGFRAKLQLCLLKLGKLNFNNACSFLFEISEKRLKNIWLYRVLAIFPLIAILSMFYRISAGVLFIILSAMINGFIYYRAKLRINKELEAIKYISGALYCCKKIIGMNVPGWDHFTTGLKECYAPFRSITSKSSALAAKSRSDFDFILEYIKILFMYDLLIYNRVINTLKKYEQDFNRLYECLGEIDAVISILSYRKSLPYYTLPEFMKSGAEMQGFSVRDIYHPLLKEPVPNSVTINHNTLITGSNASGKSTFTKAVAINGILAQSINTCTALEYHIEPCLILTSMAVKDDVTEGDSYFVAEIKSLKRVLDSLNPDMRLICFIDEILKGTNTIERIAASASIMRYLACQNCLCLVATHDIELTGILGAEGYDNFHFSEQIAEEGVLFDYKIKPGVSQTRNAIKLLEFMEFDPQIIGGALSMVDSFTESKKWT